MAVYADLTAWGKRMEQLGEEWPKARVLQQTKKLAKLAIGETVDMSFGNTIHKPYGGEKPTQINGLMQRSPVVTGQYRGHWSFGGDINDFNRQRRYSGSRGADPTGSESSRLNVALRSLSHFQSFEISNVSAQAEMIERGGSEMAPAGVVTTTLDSMAIALK